MSDVYTWQKLELIRKCTEFGLGSEGTVQELRERLTGYVRSYLSVAMETKAESLERSTEEVEVMHSEVPQGTVSS